MSDYRKAPEGQPTENIKLMLEHAQRRYVEAKLYVVELDRKLLTAREMEAYWEQQTMQFNYQLAQRGEEVNGL